MKKKLKLYVWEDVLRDWSAGVMFAMAYSPKHARKLILKACNYVGDDLNGEPKVVTKPEGFVVWGGG